MTARSTDEIREAASDLLGMCSQQGYRDAVKILVDSVPELIDSRERAIRWAVTLESQNAAALALHTPGPLLDHSEYGCTCGFSDHRWCECNGCGYILDDEGEFSRGLGRRVCPTVAALTGSTE